MVDSPGSLFIVDKYLKCRLKYILGKYFVAFRLILFLVFLCTKCYEYPQMFHKFVDLRTPMMQLITDYWFDKNVM